MPNCIPVGKKIRPRYPFKEKKPLILRAVKLNTKVRSSSSCPCHSGLTEARRAADPVGMHSSPTAQLAQGKDRSLSRVTPCILLSDDLGLVIKTWDAPSFVWKRNGTSNFCLDYGRLAQEGNEEGGWSVKDVAVWRTDQKVRKWGCRGTQLLDSQCTWHRAEQLTGVRHTAGRRGFWYITSLQWAVKNICTLKPLRSFSNYLH